MKKTGKEWADFLGVEVTSPTGWFSEKDFLSNLITKWDFLNRASQSVVIPPKGSSRREINKFRENLKKI